MLFARVYHNNGLFEDFCDENASYFLTVPGFGIFNNEAIYLGSHARIPTDEGESYKSYISSRADSAYGVAPKQGQNFWLIVVELKNDPDEKAIFFWTSAFEKNSEQLLPV